MFTIGATVVVLPPLMAGLSLRLELQKFCVDWGLCARILHWWWKEGPITHVFETQKRLFYLLQWGDGIAIFLSSWGIV